MRGLLKCKSNHLGNGGRVVFSTNGIESTGHQRWNLDPYLTCDRENNLEWIAYLKVKWNSTKLLEENIRSLCDLGWEQDSPNHDPRTKSSPRPVLDGPWATNGFVFLKACERKRKREGGKTHTHQNKTKTKNIQMSYRSYVHKDSSFYYLVLFRQSLPILGLAEFSLIWRQKHNT